MYIFQCGVELYHIYCIHYMKYYYPALLKVLFRLILNISVKYRNVKFDSYTYQCCI